MACNLDKNVKYRKGPNYRIWNIYFNNFFRFNLRCNQTNYSIIGTNKIMVINQNCNVLVFNGRFRIYPNNMNGSFRKSFIRIFKNISAFLNIKRAYGVRDINNLIVPLRAPTKWSLCPKSVVKVMIAMQHC